MKLQTIAASLLALGLLSPVAFAGNEGACYQDNRDNANYVDCLRGNFNNSSDSYGAAVVNPNARDTSDVGDFIDETREQKNQRD
jgi:hypothetical protein